MNSVTARIGMSGQDRYQLHEVHQRGYKYDMRVWGVTGVRMGGIGV
jgi:hypothetical protein